MRRSICVRPSVSSIFAILVVVLCGTGRASAQTTLNSPTAANKYNLTAGELVEFSITIPATVNGSLGDFTTCEMALLDADGNTLTESDGTDGCNVTINGDPENPTSYTCTWTVRMPNNKNT
jgi:hypothetical protein